MTALDLARELFRREPSVPHALRYEMAAKSAEIDPRSRDDALHEISMFFISLDAA